METTVRGVIALTLVVRASSAALAQTSVSSGDVTKELRFPPRGVYRNPQAVVQQYDAMSDRTRLRLGIASGNPLTLLVKPIVQLDFEATYSGAQPNAAPDSILMTSRIFRLLVTKQPPGSALQPAFAQQTPNMGSSTPGPMLSFMVSPSAADANASSASPWRTSVASVVIGSNQLVTVDDTGIWFHGRRWLAAIANAIDITRKKGESPLTLIARADTGRFSLDRLPERVRNALREGLRITITEDVHRLAIPVDALVQMANAPAGVRSRFANLDFTIEGDELNALQDFASRVGPKEGGIGSVAQTAVEQPGTTQAAVTPPVAAQDSARALGLIPAGSEIELKSASRECSDSVTLGQQFTAILARPVGSIGIAHLDAGAPVLLMVSDLQGGPPQTDAVHVRISAVSITISGRQYPLHGTVVKGTALKEAQGANSCVPINGSLILRLSRAFQVPR